MNEDEQKKYMEFQALSGQMKQIEEQLQTLNSQVMEINNIKKAIDEVKEVKAGSEVFFPISPGIFAKGKIEKVDELFINVGNNIITKKSIEQTKELLDTQAGKMDKYIEDVNRKWEEIYEQLLMMDKDLKNLKQKRDNDFLNPKKSSKFPEFLLH